MSSNISPLGLTRASSPESSSYNANSLSSRLSPRNNNLFQLLVSSSSSPPESPVSNSEGTSSNSSTSPSSLVEKLNIFRKTSSFRTSLSPLGHCETDQMRKLDLLLTDRDTRNEIVDSLLNSHATEHASYVRFLAYYNEYRQTQDKKERCNKGKKIISTFLQAGSLFQLKGIPEFDLSKVENLGNVKMFILSELVQIPSIAQKLSEST